MSIDEYLRSHTHRQHMAWVRWLEEQQNEPSRSDHYLMQIACQVVRMAVKDPKGIKLDDFKIEFTRRKPPVDYDPNADYGTIDGCPIKMPRRVTKKDIESQPKKNWAAVVEARRPKLSKAQQALQRMTFKDAK